MTDSKIRWVDVPQPSDAARLATEMNRLRLRWTHEHSQLDGSEFTVEGLYKPHLPEGSPGIPVEMENLGSTCLTRFAGFVGMVSLPQVPDEPKRGQDIKLLAPYLHHHVLRGSDWQGYIDPKWGWGTASTFTGKGHAQAIRIAVAPDGSPQQEVGERVHSELPNWWKRTAAWFELLSAEHMNPVDIFHWSEGSAAVYVADAAGETVQLIPGRSWMRSTPRPSLAWAKPNVWSCAVHLAGMEVTPPLACTLTVQALRAFREGQYRTCVTEVGAAAEIALGEALRRIRQPPEDWHTLGRIAHDARHSIHGLVPAVFRRRMVDVRNRVVHEGYLVDQFTAADAFTLAMRVVHAVYPIHESDHAGLIVTPGSRERHRFGGPIRQR